MDLRFHNRVGQDGVSLAGKDRVGSTDLRTICGHPDQVAHARLNPGLIHFPTHRLSLLVHKFPTPTPLWPLAARNMIQDRHTS